MIENKSIWDECTHLYNLSKTLRFELKPIGETLEHIKRNKLIEEFIAPEREDGFCSSYEL